MSNVEYKDIDDVYNELIYLYDKSLQKGFDLGESLYKQVAFFVDYKKLVNPDIQEKIKDYLFCKKFNCPPYQSLKDTPRQVIDEFMIIDIEHSSCINSAKNKKQEVANG